MSNVSVPSARGFAWIMQALSLVGKHPGVFIPMGLLVSIIQLIPFVGGLILFIAGPALIAGTVTAAAQSQSGNTPRMGQLFAMFEAAPKRRTALKLCLPIIAGKLAALLLLVFMLAQHIARSGADITAMESNPSLILPYLMSNQMLPWLVIGLLLIVAGWAAAALAIPEVALRDATLGDAVKFSLRCIRSSLGAWLVMTACLLSVFALWVMLLMSMHSIWLAQLGLTALSYTLLGPVFYAAWSDFSQAAPTRPDTSRDGILQA